MAPTLSSGGVASHSNAAALYGLLAPPKRHEITVARSARSGSTAWAHSCTSLASADVARVDRIPATAPARTLIDEAGTVRYGQFEDLLDLAIVTRVVRPTRLRARATELWAPRRRGCAVVLELLDQRDPELLNTWNIWEARVLRMVRAAGLPLPRKTTGFTSADEIDPSISHGRSRRSPLNSTALCRTPADASSTTTECARTTLLTTTGSCFV